jgi:transcription elongation GreA/GreB family factor
MYKFLRKDARGLEEKLRELSDELRKVNEDAANWARQSSETWHDNFGFEEGERQKRALMRRIDEIRAIKSRIIIVSTPEGDKVEVGTRVCITDEGGIERSFVISSYMIFTKRMMDELSYEAPVGKALMYHSKGDEIEIKTGRGSSIVEITDIKIAAELFFDSN